MKLSFLTRSWPGIAMAMACALPLAHAATPDELLAAYTKQAGKPAEAERGQKFFTSRHGREYSCANCHGSTPTKKGTHQISDKAIEPLAPAANGKRFTDTAHTEKWFRMNCNEVLGRECNAGEKADVLSWLLTLKP